MTPYKVGDSVLVPGPSTPAAQRRAVVIEVPAVIDGIKLPVDVRVRMRAPDDREFVLGAFSLMVDPVSDVL